MTKEFQQGCSLISHCPVFPKGLLHTHHFSDVFTENRWRGTDVDIDADTDVNVDVRQQRRRLLARDRQRNPEERRQRRRRRSRRRRQRPRCRFRVVLQERQKEEQEGGLNSEKIIPMFLRFVSDETKFWETAIKYFYPVVENLVNLRTKERPPCWYDLVKIYQFMKLPNFVSLECLTEKTLTPKLNSWE